MIRLQPITPACVADFKSTRLRALQDTPTAFGSTYAKESQLTDADWLRRASQWNSERSVAYLAWDDDQPCGIVASVIDESDHTKAHLLSMWVGPAHRRRGAGQMLVKAVIDWAKQKKITTLSLDVTSNNDGAIRFYESLGFVRNGNTKPYPNDPALIEFEMVRAMVD